MGKAKIAITLDEEYIEQIDKLVGKNVFQSRSQAVQEAVGDKLQRIKRSRLSKECKKLDPAFERAIAEEGLSKDIVEWPEY